MEDITHNDHLNGGWPLGTGFRAIPHFHRAKTPTTTSYSGVQGTVVCRKRDNTLKVPKKKRNIMVNNLVLFLDSAKSGRLGHPLFFSYVILFMNCRWTNEQLGDFPQGTHTFLEGVRSLSNFLFCLGLCSSAETVVFTTRRITKEPCNCMHFTYIHIYHIVK